LLTEYRVFNPEMNAEGAEAYAEDAKFSSAYLCGTHRALGAFRVKFDPGKT